jgi:YfiH family protein
MDHPFAGLRLVNYGQHWHVLSILVTWFRSKTSDTKIIMLVPKSENGFPYLQFQNLPNSGRLFQAIFTRQGGVSQAPFDSLNLSVSVPDKKERVYANRRIAYGLFGRDTDNVVHAHLVHGADVALVSHRDYGTWIPYTDGIITNEPGVALTMNFADCAPIFLYDPRKQAIGLGHAGWLGSTWDLPGALVRAMTESFGSEPRDLIAGIGPCIGPCCYEVGEPVISKVLETFEDGESLLIEHGNGERPHYDLPEANRRNLERAGVLSIEQSGFCTACHTDLFFSHRAEKGKTGRFGTILILGET